MRAALVGLVAVGAALRFYHLTAIGLWYDEAVSLHLVDAPWPDAFHRIQAEIGPPLYFILLKVWTSLAGHTALGLRSFSVVCGLAAIPVAYGLASEGFRSRRAGFAAAALFAVNPLQIQYSGEGRAYALGVLLVLSSSLVLIRAMRSDRLHLWLIYACLAAACLYTHYYLLFVIAGHGLAVMVFALARLRFERTSRMRLIAGPLIGFATAAALYAPWLPEFLRERRTIAANFWVDRVGAGTYLDIAPKLLAGVRQVHPVFTMTALAVVIVALVYAFWRGREPETWVVLAPILVTFIGSLPAVTGTRAVVDRYFVFAAACLLVLAARMLSDLKPPPLGTGVLMLAVLASLGAFLDGWRQMDVVSIVHLSGPVRRPGMAGAARFLDGRTRPEDRIVVSSSLIYFPFRRYNTTGIDPRLYADRPLAQFPAFAGRDLLTEGELLFDWRTVPAGSRVWLIWTNGYWQSKPALPASWRLVATAEFPDAPDFKGSVFVDEYVVRAPPSG